MLASLPNPCRSDTRRLPRNAARSASWADGLSGEEPIEVTVAEGITGQPGDQVETLHCDLIRRKPTLLLFHQEVDSFLTPGRRRVSSSRRALKCESSSDKLDMPFATDCW